MEVPTQTANVPLHSDAIECGGCGKSNSRDRKFCSQCGQSLWYACHECGESYAVGESFCGSCGANLGSALDEKVASFDAEIERACSFRATFEFDRAINLLASLARETDGRLAPQILRVNALLDEVTREKETAAARAEAAFQEAKQLTKTNSYEAIIGILSDIPEAIRTDEMEALLNLADSRRSEILSLTGDIRVAVESNQIQDLMPKLERLLELVPGHKQAKTLAVQVRDQLLKSAKLKLAKHQYKDAHDTLLEISEFAQSEEIKNLLVKIDELVWLSDDLRNSPTIDPVLVLISERLHQLTPTNSQVAKLNEQLKARAGARSKDPRFPSIPWAKTPKRGFLGFPVDVLGGSAKISGWQNLKSNHHRKFPSAFLISCGLALQGVGLARIATNLAPKKKSLLSNLGIGGKGFSFRKKKPEPQTAWGLDLGGSSLKAVKLIYDETTERLEVQACERIEYTRPLNQVENITEEREIIKQALTTFKAREEIGENDRLCVSIRGSSVIARFVKIPPVDDKLVEKTVTFEVENQIPIPIAEIGWDYQQITDQQDDKDQRRLMLLASKKSAIEERLLAFKELQLGVDILQGEAVALQNFVLHEMGDELSKELPIEGDSEGKTAKPVVAILDVGCELTNLVFAADDLISFRSFSVAGQQFTNAIVKPFGLTANQAEQVKINPAKVKSFRRLFEAYHPVFTNLTDEIERSLAAFEREHAGRKISRMFLVGGGSQMHGLLRCFAFGPDELQGKATI